MVTLVVIRSSEPGISWIGASKVFQLNMTGITILHTVQMLLACEQKIIVRDTIPPSCVIEGLDTVYAQNHRL